MEGLLLGASKHIVDEWTIDVCAAEANRIEQLLMIGNKISGVRQLIRHHLIVAGVTQHHQSA